jgi:hypothetical protein
MGQAVYNNRLKENLSNVHANWFAIDLKSLVMPITTFHTFLPTDDVIEQISGFAIAEAAICMTKSRLSDVNSFCYKS